MMTQRDQLKHDLLMVAATGAAIILCILVIIALSLVTSRLMGVGANYRAPEANGAFFVMQIDRHDFNSMEVP